MKKSHLETLSVIFTNKNNFVKRSSGIENPNRNELNLTFVHLKKKKKQLISLNDFVIQ